jgi:hypothetical protein
VRVAMRAVKQRFGWYSTKIWLHDILPFLAVFHVYGDSARSLYSETWEMID